MFQQSLVQSEVRKTDAKFFHELLVPFASGEYHLPLCFSNTIRNSIKSVSWLFWHSATLDVFVLPVCTSIRVITVHCLSLTLRLHKSFCVPLSSQENSYIFSSIHFSIHCNKICPAFHSYHSPIKSIFYISFHKELMRSSIAWVIFSEVCDDSSQIRLLIEHPSLVKVPDCPKTYI